MDKLKSNVLAGNLEAFKVWMTVNIRKIELLALQFGMSSQDAGSVAEKVFRDMYSSLDEWDESIDETELYRKALGALDKFQTTSEEELLTFQEDNELHGRVRALPRECRVPFILERFHGKSIMEIAEINELTEQQIDIALHKALNLINEPNLEKKLDFLSLSYQRLPVFHDESNIFIQNTIEPPAIEEKSVMINRKKTYLYLGMWASIFLLLMFFTVTGSDAYQRSSVEKFIEKSKVTFMEELNNNLRLAGLQETNIAIGDAYLQTYGEETRRKFENLITDLEHQLETSKRINKKKAKADFDKLIHELSIPSQMIVSLSAKPLVHDEQASMEFVDEYYSKMLILFRSYMHILYENENLIHDPKWNNVDGFDFEAFYENRSNYPEEFQLALSGMVTQGFTLKMEQPSYVHAVFGNSELNNALRENLHSDAQIYLSVLDGSHYEILERPIKEQVDQLLLIEESIVRNKNHSQLRTILFSPYLWLMYSIMGNGEQTRMYNSTGTLKEEYKEEWQRIASNGDESPSAQIMTTIVEEMDASNWTTSSYLEKLEIYDLDSKLRELFEGIQ